MVEKFKNYSFGVFMRMIFKTFLHVLLKPTNWKKMHVMYNPYGLMTNFFQIFWRCETLLKIVKTTFSSYYWRVFWSPVFEFLLKWPYWKKVYVHHLWILENIEFFQISRDMEYCWKLQKYFSDGFSNGAQLKEIFVMYTKI